MACGLLTMLKRLSESCQSCIAIYVLHQSQGGLGRWYTGPSTEVKIVSALCFNLADREYMQFFLEGLKDHGQVQYLDCMLILLSDGLILADASNAFLRRIPDGYGPVHNTFLSQARSNGRCEPYLAFWTSTVFSDE